MRVQPFVLSARDYQQLLQHCTKAEIKVYEALLRAAAKAPHETFLAAGYIVADTRFAEMKNHGRRKSHIANLINKELIVPLNPARSHTQLYLLGCIVGGKTFFVSWVQEIHTLRVPVQVQSALDSFEISKRGLRPSAPETLKSLLYKGFVPFSPSEPSFNTARDKEIDNRAPVRPEAKPPRRNSAFSRQQRHALAVEISGLAGTPIDAWGKSGAQLDTLLRDHGFEEALKIVHEAWLARASLLNGQYRTFTAQSVWFYAHNRRTSNRAAEPCASDISFQTLIQESLTPNGDIDYERLRNALILHGMQRTRMHDAICEEYGLNPALVFGAQ